MKITLTSLRNVARLHGWEVISPTTAVEIASGDFLEESNLEDMAKAITRHTLEKRRCNTSKTQLSESPLAMDE